MNPAIEEFAKKLVEFVRDRSIQTNDIDISPTAGSPVAKRWKQAAPELSTREFARTVIPDVVDETVFVLLQAIDEGLLPIAFKSEDGKAVDLTVEGHGELAGWYIASGGWRAMYSRQRFTDDFADLHLE